MIYYLKQQDIKKAHLRQVSFYKISYRYMTTLLTRWLRNDDGDDADSL